MKRTKITCTIGPASERPSTLRSLTRAGMNVARLNLSHGTHASHARLIRSIRATARETGEPIAILADLQGPKIRLGELPEEGVDLKGGEDIVLSTSARGYKKGVLPVTYAGLHKDVKKGHRILIDDGLLEAEVLGVSGRRIRARVVNGGKVTSHKGMNFPDSTLSLSSLTRKDRDDVVFAVGKEVDWMALSFVTDPADVRLLRRLIKRAGKKGQVLPRIIVKIEKHEAIDRFDEILEETDAVMVARGDLGIEIPAEQVPVAQKQIVEACRLAGKPVVVATQMLDSMIRNPRPTRAEVSDVANAVFDHADAVMLSGESATGKYPVKAVKAMAAIVHEAEESPFDDLPIVVGRDEHLYPSVAHAIRMLALSGHVDGILGSMALAPWSEELLMARPEIPLLLACPSDTEMRQANIRWGVRPFVLKKADRRTFVRRSIAALRKRRMVKKGMRLAVVMGGEHGAGFDLVDVE